MTTQQRVDVVHVGIDEREAKTASLLVKLTFAVVIVCLIIGAAIFWGVGDALGQDIGALTWVIGFAGAVALMSIRQLILAERE